ncbi:MAG TPA: prephenate dehydrogenase/arogenate dehydrogenase family protein [Desulfitobacteriaceae bacterium]|nr:prephenate dehydrogenase/arogenate dehydrogenase family protein [Desulfitobacteriaceae bacterium]
MLAKQADSLLSAGWSGGRVPRACVFGLGLIGGSWSGALAKQGWDVSAVEQDPESLQQALDCGWIQVGWPEAPAEIDADLIIAALPLHQLNDSLACLMGRLKRGCIVTDVGSVKAEICLQSRGFAQRGIYFIGGHPMAGSEKSGFKAADADLFRGYPYVLTPEADCPPDVVAELKKLILSLGADVILRQASEHDREVAMISHLPHMLAVALALAARDVSEQGLPALELAGRSFRDLTRIADSSPVMWQEILVKNGPAILEGLTSWQKRIDELAEFVRHGNRDGISGAFNQARLVRESLFSKDASGN